MNPRTVEMAAIVAASFTSTQLEEYGNIILNGYPSTTLAVSAAGAIGAIAAITISDSGSNYVDGTYPRVYLSSATGTFAYATVVVSSNAVASASITTGGRGFAVGDVITLGGIPSTTPGTVATLTVDSVDQYSVRPAAKGWTTNYDEYYTKLPVNDYGVNPGDPTGFYYNVHSYTQPNGPITAFAFASPDGRGVNYTPGTYTNVATVNISSVVGFGGGATLDITVGVNGKVATVTLNNPGTGYSLDDILTAAPGTIGPGQQFGIYVTDIAAVPPGYASRWAQPPRILSGNVPVPYHSILYPVGDRVEAPPIDSLG